MRRAHGSRLLLSLLPVSLALAMAPAQAQQPAPTQAVAPGALEAYLKAHKGPVLDVRQDGDCDPARRLSATTHTVGFDFGPDDAAGKKKTQQAFLSKVRAQRTLGAAAQSKTPILVICCAGGRSGAAAELLSKNGFATAFLDGGAAGESVPAALLRKP